MESSEIPKYVMSTLCRICAEKSSTLTPIFENEALDLKICKCLPIQVNESDFLPLKICESCFVKINESYILYVKADEADKRLKRLWKILLNETMVKYSEGAQNTENMTPDVIVTQEQLNSNSDTSEMNLYNCESLNPEPIACHSIGISSDGYLVNGEANQVFVISQAVSFEVITESVVLESSEKSGNQLPIEETQEEKILPERKEEISEKNTAQQIQQSPSPITCSVPQSDSSLEKPYLCDTCGKLFKSAKYLKKHSETHSVSRKRHVCKICNKGFLKNFHLREHMNSHTGLTPYKCPVCGKEFREGVHLRQHRWTHSTPKFVCPICGTKFNRKGNMTEHLKKHSRKKSSGVNSKKESKENAEANLKCPACNSEFPNQALLKTHLKSHPEQKRFCCATCGKKFHHSGSLTYHRRTAHTGERPFQCSYCDMKFSLRSVQIIHERKTHTFERPYKCNFCSRPFTNASVLKNHMHVHAEDKMFQCDECGKKFSRKSNLIMHKKLHSGDRKFVCDHCGKSYIQRYDLLKHQKVHDPKSKPFFCKYCGNSFSHKKDSVKHAMCRFDFFRKRSSDMNAAEQILNSVTNLEKDGEAFSAEEEQQFILDSVEELSGEKIIKDDVLYGGP